MYTDTSETTPHPASSTSHQGKVIGNDTILTYVCTLSFILISVLGLLWIRFSEYEEGIDCGQLPDSKGSFWLLDSPLPKVNLTSVKKALKKISLTKTALSYS